MSTVHRCEYALLPDGTVGADVDVEVGDDGRILRVGGVGVTAAAHVEHLHGLVLPGAANAHSHAFHRALRGRTHDRGGSFWTWREQMYAVAHRLEPDTYGALAEAVFAEMVLAGFTSVGEFHYVHHRPDGTPYGDPNAMGEALVAAARAAGIRLTLLDTCYLTGGIGEPLADHQTRFGPGADVTGPACEAALAWARRAATSHAAHLGQDDVVVGAAIHSVRAVPPEALPIVAAWARDRDVPLHVHVAEQPAENEACRRAHGRSPVALLQDAGALGPRTTGVHATHLDDADVGVLATTGTTVALCPTTERDLGDGIGPADRLAAAGVPLAIGTDSHAVIDPFEEARGLEGHTRLLRLARGCLTPAQLVEALTAAGQRALGWHDAGRLAVGARADLIAVDLRSVRTAGALATTSSAGVAPAAALTTALFAATAADVTDVVVDGRRVVQAREHHAGDVAGRLTRTIAAVTA